MKYQKTNDNRATARTSFTRLMGFTFLAAVATVAATLIYLGWNDLLTVGRAFGIGFAVFLSVMLGAGLMATAFYSANAGHDDAATARSKTKPTSRVNE